MLRLKCSSVIDWPLYSLTTYVAVDNFFFFSFASSLLGNAARHIELVIPFLFTSLLLFSFPMLQPVRFKHNGNKAPTPRTQKTKFTPGSWQDVLVVVGAGAIPQRGGLCWGLISHPLWEMSPETHIILVNKAVYECILRRSVPASLPRALVDPGRNNNNNINTLPSQSTYNITRKRKGIKRCFLCFYYR